MLFRCRRFCYCRSGLGIQERPLSCQHRHPLGRRSRRCGDYRTEPRWQDHGLAGQGDSRHFNSLLHAGQYDVISALAFSGLVCFLRQAILTIATATAAPRAADNFDVGQGIARHFGGTVSQMRRPVERIPGEDPMCDYSLHAVASRPAKVGETLVTTSFYGTSTRGFAAKEELGVAVCLLPGTELAFERDVRYNRNWLSTGSTGFSVARFCAIEPGAAHQHYDALSFPDGKTVLLNLLWEV